MKTGTTNIHSTNLSRRAAILLGTIAALLIAVACTEKPKPSVVAEKPVSAMVRPAALNTSTPEIAKPISMEAAEQYICLGQARPEASDVQEPRLWRHVHISVAIRLSEREDPCERQRIITAETRRK